MDTSAAFAYTNAKAGGILSKSFVGTRAEKLFSVKSLRELYSLLFSSDAPHIPEAMLAKEIEVQAEKSFIDSFVKLIKNFSSPSPIFSALLHFYDYDNLKEIVAALSLGEREMPKIADVHEFSLLNYKAWPNLKKITADSPVSWYNEIPEIEGQQNADSRLDSQYIEELWNAVESLPASERVLAKRLIGAEISSRNMLWVIRLKVYYKMDSDKIRAQLAFANKKAKKSDVLAGEALSIIEKDVGNFGDWKNWKYADHLNPHEEGVIWEIDPVWVERAFRRDFVRMAIRSFHKNPMSVMSLVSWFKIKQNELDSIRTVAEGLRLGETSKKLMAVAEFSDENNN